MFLSLSSNDFKVCIFVFVLVLLIDDKFLLIGGLRYETYLINMETMEKNIRIFNKNLTYDIFCFLKSEKYIFVGGEK